MSSVMQNFPLHITETPKNSIITWAFFILTLLNFCSIFASCFLEITRQWLLPLMLNANYYASQ